MKSPTQQDILELYGDKLRIRVVGICFQNNKILFVKHKSITKSGIFWSPPGGGMQVGETAHEALKREFLEETGLDIVVKRLLFVNEFNKSPLYAIELFFAVDVVGGNLKVGLDPEMSLANQIIESVEFLSLGQIQENAANFHPIFANIHSLETIHSLNGYAFNGVF